MEMTHTNQPLKINSKFILMIAMFYVTVSVAADVVAFKFTNFFGFLESGATILFPLTYILGDVASEVYGWNTAMKIVWLGLICEALFALMVTSVIYIPSYGIGNFQSEYIDVLGKVWLFITGGIISNAVAGLLNVFFISKWKILMKGKIFWVRSIFSTCISEFILIILTVLIAFTPFIHLKATMHVFVDAYTLEILYAFIFVVPAQLFVKFLKTKEGIDAYDYGVSYNPFNFI